jgi:hypothetical protein
VFGPAPYIRPAPEKLWQALTDPPRRLELKWRNKEGPKFIEAVSGGWPAVLSSLKSLLETGSALPSTK